MKTSESVLLARYIDRKSKKVVESRKELLARFEYLSFSDQKKIVIAFLKSAKRSDIDWAAEEARKRWDRSYVDPIKDAFQNYDSYSLALTILMSSVCLSISSCGLTMMTLVEMLLFF